MTRVLGRSITVPQIRLLRLLLAKVGLDGDRDAQLAYYTHVAARPITSSKDLTTTEAGWVIDDLETYTLEGRGFLAQLRGER